MVNARELRQSIAETETSHDSENENDNIKLENGTSNGYHEGTNGNSYDHGSEEGDFNDEEEDDGEEGQYDNYQCTQKFVYLI